MNRARVEYVRNLENVLVFKGRDPAQGGHRGHPEAVRARGGGVKNSCCSCFKVLQPTFCPTPECPEVVKAPLDQ